MYESAPFSCLRLHSPVERQEESEKRMDKIENQKSDEKGKSFKEIFLEHYLEHGLGSLSKSDIDALVMHLLDIYGWKDVKSFADLPNQIASVKLKTPISKIKKLRYEAALKFGSVEETEKKCRNLVLKALKSHVWRKDENYISFILESTLARNWLQSELKLRGVVYDSSFNSEIVRLDIEDFVQVIVILLGDDAVAEIRKQILKEKFCKVIDVPKDIAVNATLDLAKGVVKLGLIKLGIAIFGG